MVNCMRSAAERVLSLLLVVLLIASVVGLAASQTFINKTGKTVIGIKIEFSKGVLIVRYDSVFPDQSPSGRSTEFTFNNGNLRNLGRFTVSWVPSSGKVTDYQWIEKAQPSQEPQATPTQQNNTEQEVKLPDPNTPPILYGNDYPGPDEPKYQPEPDEQIWLTDLEGHGDIYDNDSIKINYAPGFDASQITKIEVYRNGVYMRFLPEKLNVLTNAQMKTFDGNYYDHSPASNHTDHAIMGYEYEFKISTADHLWILKKTVKSGFRWHPKEVWAHIDGNWTISMEKLSYTEMIQFFKELQDDGFTGIALNIDYFMMTPYDNEVFELETRDPSMSAWNIKTASLDELEEILKAISSVGLDAHVRGVISISKKYQDEHGFAWSSLIDPTDPQEFFDSYTKLWLKLIPLLNKYHVKLLSPFTEMEGIEKYPELIKEMYTKISTQYNGEMGFEEATNHMLEGTSPMQHGRTFMQMVRNFTFWDWKDSQRRPMRIEYSCWAPPLETQKDQRVSVMMPNFVKFWSIPVNYYRSTYPQGPQMFGEIGVYNADGVGLGPAYWNITHKVFDDQEVADIWYIYLKGAKELGINSLNIWSIPLGDLWLNDFAGGIFINTGLRQPKSPAYRVITSIIAPEGD